MARNIEILLSFIESFAQLHSEESRDLAGKIFLFAKNFLESKSDSVVEKRVYKMIQLLIESYPVKIFEDYMRIYAEIQQIPFHSVRKNRIKMIYSLIQRVFKFQGEVLESEREGFVCKLMPEILIGYRDSSAKTRKLVEELMNSVAGKVVSVKRFTFKLLAGVTGGSPGMKSASIGALASLIKSFSEEFTAQEIEQVIEVVILMIKSSEIKSDKEYVRSGFSFIKGTIKMLSEEMNKPFIHYLVRTLLSCKFFQSLKTIGKLVFEKLIKKYSYEAIKDVTVHSHHPFLLHTFKQMKREKRNEILKNIDSAIQFEERELKTLKPWLFGNMLGAGGIDDERVMMRGDS